LSTFLKTIWILKFGNSFQKFNKISQIYTRKTHLSKNFPICLVQQMRNSIEKLSMLAAQGF
jgi:hypothetical protein